MAPRRKASKVLSQTEGQTAEDANVHSGKSVERADLAALFRLLLREPPDDHDFKNCAICKRYGITRI